MQNTKAKILIKIIVFGLILSACIFVAGKILVYKVGTDKYKDFYKEDSQFDVLFFGSSRVLDAFQPMELWEEYGIRSYNMAQHAEGLGRNYWQIKNALKHQVPRLVVVDISAYYGLYEVDANDADQMGALHKQLDHIPLSFAKLETINELCPKGSRAEFIFPFILYHDRWNDLTASDFTSYFSKDSRKGSESRFFYEVQTKPVWDDTVIEESFTFENTKIREIIDLCNEYNTEVLFVNLPYCFDSERQGMINYIGEYFKENNIPYINYQTEADFIDYSLDFADPEHLNTAGSIKLTNDFGRYFIENYGRSECDAKTENEWNEVLSLYRDEKTAIINSYNTYLELLMLTYADNDYDVKVIASSERLDYTGTRSFFPDMPGVDDFSGYRIEISKKGETEPFKVWEVE